MQKNVNIEGMKPLNEMSLEDIKKIKMIVFDVDGVLVKRGTNIKQVGNTTTLETKVIAEKQIKQIKELYDKGYLINISSGRGLYMLQEMFRGVLPFVSLTYENGSATWYQGKIYQHINSFKYLQNIFSKLKQEANKNKNVKGFEPKEFIITIHCKKKIEKIEKIVSEDKNLYTIWNGEAYDIGIKNHQTKALGLREIIKVFKLKKENTMAIGDNYNDQELLEESGIPVSADKTRVNGQFFIPLEGKFLPADNLMQKILMLKS